MRDQVVVTGMVLRSAPVGEYDKRIVILTRERGRITAFARGARRPGNQLMAVSRPFAFGVFRLYEGREAYSLSGADISNYFENITDDIILTCYGTYMLEMAEYYTRENVNETEMLKLIYQSLRALSKPSLKHELVRRIYELKSMVIGGEYTAKPPKAISDSGTYTWEYVVLTEPEKLYTFTVTDEVLREFSECVDMSMRRYIDRTFHSLDILKSLLK